VAPLPAVRPRWPGKKIDMRKFSAAHSMTISPVVKVLHERHSTRIHDQSPITWPRAFGSSERGMCPSTWKQHRVGVSGRWLDTPSSRILGGRRYRARASPRGRRVKGASLGILSLRRAGMRESNSRPHAFNLDAPLTG
jgi:hypothetical protein